MGRALVLGCIVAVASCASQETPPEGGDLHEGAPVSPTPQPSTTPQRAHAEDASVQHGDATPTARREAIADAPASETDATTLDRSVLAATRDPRLDPPNQCERLRVQIDEDGRRRYKRIRRSWTKADQQRFSSLVGLVAREMGADPRLIRIWAMRESTYRPHAMHVLNPDIEAATAAWRRLHYSPREEAELQAQMAAVTPQDPRYWQAKARLHQVQTFRDNVFLDDVVELEVVAPDETQSWGTEPAWAFGYGPFGFNPAYFVPVWDSTAPPWVFCEDDGLAAIITAVWAARTAQRECEAQGFSGSYASVNRRFSKGHCGDVGERSKFHQRARRQGIDPEARAKLGSKWKRAETDRPEILRAMREKAVAAGLLERRGPSSGS